MPRLIALLLVLLAGVGLVAWAARHAARTHAGSDVGARPRHTFRPSPSHSKGFHSKASQSKASPPNSSRQASSPWQSSQQVDPASHPFVMPKGSTASLRDALTGASIDEQGQIWRCLRCQSLYNLQSAQALALDNAGKCVLCACQQRCPVVFADTEPS